MKNLILIVLYLFIAYMAYGWIGVYWSIPLFVFLRLGLWEIADKHKDSVFKNVIYKINKNKSN